MDSEFRNRYAFLDEIEGAEALAWAAERSADTVEKLGERGALRQRLEDALNTDARIPMPRRRGELLFNFWRDEAHPRGVWRTTTLESYQSSAPNWRTLIDVDTLAELEQENWVWKGAHVRSPTYDRAMVRLSRGGSDASVLREYDLLAEEFVEDGFVLPEAKSDVSWLDRDTLLLGTDMGDGTLTESGYPAHVYRWQRGTPLEEAELVFAGESTDVAVGGWHDDMPGFERTFFTRSIDFYRSQTFLETAEGLLLIDVPLDCSISTFRQWLFILPRTACFGIEAGGLGCIELESFLAGDRDFRPVFVPSPTSCLQGMTFTQNYLVLTVLENVATQIRIVPVATPWDEAVPLGDWGTSTVSVIGTSPLRDDELWLSTASFIQPTTLWRGVIGQEFSEIKQAPELFDSAGMETRQHWAESADGTLIPYFITGKFAEQPLPTLVHAYGGFEVSLLPYYSGTRGIAWMEQGGLFVEANLRGGGEFGPDWHSAAVGKNRHKVWEDHRAVLEDLVQRGYTTADQLGIRGGSNGGLLTAGALVQYPEDFGAAVVQVPLIDMERFHRLSAGASWIAEYGNPENPEELESIREWSPLGGVDKQRLYPPALVTTSTRDDRVHPAHARLFVAALEETDHQVSYWENMEGGHAGAANNHQTAEMDSLIYTWLWQQLG